MYIFLLVYVLPNHCIVLCVLFLCIYNLHKWYLCHRSIFPPSQSTIFLRCIHVILCASSQLLPMCTSTTLYLSTPPELDTKVACNFQLLGIMLWWKSSSEFPMWICVRIPLDCMSRRPIICQSMQTLNLTNFWQITLQNDFSSLLSQTGYMRIPIC